MTVFTRTNSGITNSAAFLGVDIIVYTEGGNISYSMKDVESGKFNKKSIDIKFWNGLFNVAQFSKKVEFRALGSKSSSYHIREKIITNQIKNVAVVVDKDLDFLLAEPIFSPFILFTKGYSWENDVYTEENTFKQISSMVLEQDIPNEIVEEIQSAYSDFKRIGKRLLRLEIIFRSQHQRFITEINGERFFNHKKSSCIDKAQLIAFIKQKKHELRTRPATMPHVKYELCEIKDNYGKLIASLSKNIISYLCKKHLNHTSIPAALIECFMIERYLKSQEKECDKYYLDLIKSLESA